MSEFWVAFLGGLASGVALSLLTALIRRFFRSQAKGERPLRLDIKELRPFVPIITGLILIVLALSFSDTPWASSLVGIAAFLLAFGAVAVLR